MDKINLMDLSFEETEKFIESIGEKRFRAKQIFQWIYRGVESFDEMTNISADLRERLSQNSFTGYLRIASKLVSKIDGTIKYLFELEDGNAVESVLMKYKYGYSICISTQVGCKMGCTFCASAPLGFKRNLTAGEILGQIITVQRDSGEKISNVVLMGIGEPLDNYDNVMKFLKLANDERGLGIGARHFSLSTSGIVPRIYALMKENFPLTLSISLHSTNDTDRSAIMPVNRKYSIDKLIEACKIYTKETGRRITFEYAMISGVNDSAEKAKELGRLIKGMLCHVNLIPVNNVEGTGFIRSGRKTIEKFIEVLSSYGVEATVRRELGSDISAACGQLRRSAVESGKGSGD